MEGVEEKEYYNKDVDLDMIISETGNEILNKDRYAGSKPIGQLRISLGEKK